MNVVCQAYVESVSTRRVDDLVRSMGIEGMGKSQFFELAKNLDLKVAEFRDRPLDAGPYTYVWLDAPFHKVREGGRVVSVATVVATGVPALVLRLALRRECHVPRACQCTRQFGEDRKVDV